MANERIDLNLVFARLRDSGSNFIEFYDRSGKTKKRFREVYSDVLKAAAALEDRGLKRGDRVGILGHSGYEWIVVDLACLAKGLHTIPFDANAQHDVAAITREYKLNLLLTNLPGDEFAGADIGHFDALCGWSGPAPDLAPMAFGEDEAFTTVFTSCTTGQPNAIEVRKKCFDDQFVNAQRMFQLGSGDKILIFLPLHIYLERCYVYLAILLDFNAVFAPSAFVLKAIKNDGITFTVGVPHFFEMLYDLFMREVQTNEDVRRGFEQRQELSRAGRLSDLEEPFAPLLAFWGGKARFFLTGSAPCSHKILAFYRDMGIPLYEGYGMSEIAGMLALNFPGNMKIGTVGKIFPNKEIELDAAGQILVRGECVANTRYYNASDEVNDATFLPGGWIATGDIGHFDEEGYLTIDGRVKDLIAMSNGKKVHPSAIEDVIVSDAAIANCVVFGDNQPYLIALVAPKSAEVDEQTIARRIEETNASLPSDERIVKYSLLSEPFTPENGMLTPALKLNRKFIKEKFADLIEELYSP